jgi:hypothetical protein
VIFEIDDKFVIKRRLDSSFYREFLRIESHVVCEIHDEVAKMLDNVIQSKGFVMTLGSQGSRMT